MVCLMHLGLTPWNFTRSGAGDLAAQARFAEDLGYESFWLPENHFNPGAIPDPLMLLSAVAAGTRTIRLGTTSFLLPLRHPLQAAEQVAVLDQLSGGRVILGVGRGFAPDMLKAFNVVPKEKRAMFERALETMMRAWSGEPVSVDGHEDLSVVLDPLPVQSPLPIWVAAFGPKALAQAGGFGLPYLASPMETIDSLQANFERVDDAARQADKPAPAQRPIMRTVYVSDSSTEIRELKTRLNDASIQSQRRDGGAEIDEYSIIGDRAEVADRIAEYEDRLGVTHLVATRLRVSGVPEDQLKTSLELLADIIA
jgi:alkanesulfonate monooxygenase SsuD/methylene tetrahydromethanopterin reductase-like flavin-dependent oxidoreductase (luciferase family)